MAPDLFIDQNSINVCVRALPGGVRAFSMPYNDGYTVVINDNMSPCAKITALKHELDHIERGDHHNPEYQEYI